MTLPERCPSCGGGLKPAMLGSMRDKHLICPFCHHHTDVPDEFETHEVEESKFPGGYKRVERRVTRRDISIPLSGPQDDVAAKLRDILRDHANELGIDPESITIAQSETGEVDVESARDWGSAVADAKSLPGKGKVIETHTVKTIRMEPQVKFVHFTRGASTTHAIAKMIIQTLGAILILVAAIWMFSRMGAFF